MIKSPRFSKILFRILKYLGITIVFLFILFGIVTWIIFEKKNDWLLSKIQSYMNESQSGELKIAAVDFKLFRNFPNVTIELEGINYYEHLDSLRMQNEKPILHAEKIFVAFELMPLFKDELHIKVISLSKAQVNIVKYQNGKLNIDLAMAKPSKEKVALSEKMIVTKPSTKPSARIVETKSAIQVDLNRIDLSDIIVTWISYSVSKPIVIFLKELEVDLIKNGKVLTAKINSTNLVQAVHVKDSLINLGDIGLNADLQYDLEKKLLTLQEIEIKYDLFSANIHGAYNDKENQKLDLQFEASSKNLEFLSLFLDPDLIKRNQEFFKQSNIDIKGRVFGELNKQPLQTDISFDLKNPNLLSFIIKAPIIKENADLLKQVNSYVKGRVFGELNQQTLRFDISFGMKGLALRLPKKLGTFRDIGFDGIFSSGSLKDNSDALLEIKNLRGQLPGGFLKGQFKVRNFAKPYLSYKLDSRINLDGYDQIFQIDFLKNLTGAISIKANFDGPLKLIDKHKMDNSRSSIITLNNISFVIARTNQLVSGLSAKIETSHNQTSIQNLAFVYGKNDLQINATIDNLFYILFKNDREIISSGNLRSNQIYTQDFILDTLKRADVQDRISNLFFDFQISRSAISDSDTTGKYKVNFNISKLTAQLDKLPNIKLLNTSGWFSQSTSGLNLGLNKFHATMPQGNIDVTGDMLIPKKRFLQFNAKIKMNRFPWTYVKELIAEIKTDKEPNAKNLPVSKMEIVNADLDLSAELITYPFDINKLEVRNSRAQYFYSDTNSISSQKINLSFDKIHFNHPENSGNLTGLNSVNGTLELRQLKIPAFAMFDINMHVSGKNDKLDIAFSRVAQMTKSENGYFVLDNSKAKPEYHLNYAVREADLEYFINKFYNNKFMTGKVNYVLDLRSSGSDWAKVKQNIAGIIEIKGDSLHLYGIDVDDLLTKFKKSQNFNLTDLGAVIIAGPVGLAVTKGSDFVSLAKVNFDSTKQTNIHTLLSRWRFENRQIITEDVAVTTKLNRIAFNGIIDFANDSIPGLTVAVVDKNGCSLMDQKLYGKMNSLQTGKLNITKTIFGSVINSVDAVVGKDCKPVYTGKVKNPTQ